MNRPGNLNFASKAPRLSCLALPTAGPLSGSAGFHQTRACRESSSVSVFSYVSCLWPAAVRSQLSLRCLSIGPSGTSSAAITHRTLTVILSIRNAHVCAKIVTRTITNITCSASRSESKKQYGNQVFHFFLGQVECRCDGSNVHCGRGFGSFWYVARSSENLLHKLFSGNQPLLNQEFRPARQSARGLRW